MFLNVEITNKSAEQYIPMECTRPKSVHRLVVDARNRAMLLPFGGSAFPGTATNHISPKFPEEPIKKAHPEIGMGL
jgi:hypothetical protein